MILAAAEWFEILAALIFLLVTAAAQALQKRFKNRGEELPDAESDADIPPGQRPERHPRPLLEADETLARDNWEQQLRRLLEGESTSTAPPVLAPSPPPQPTPRIPQPARPTRIPREAPPVRATPGPTAVEQAHRAAAARLSAAADSYRHIAGRHEAVPRVAPARRAPTARAPRVQGRATSRRASEVISMFRHPQGAQQAIIAATVLQPPKALE